MMKFSEVNKEYIYGNLADRGVIISEDLKTVIDEWFNLREVVDDDNFNTFFERVLYNDYFRYIQLLRLEPGVSEYDWLVTKYRERLYQHTGTSTKDNLLEESSNGTSRNTSSTSASDVNRTNDSISYGHNITTQTDKDIEETSNDTRTPNLTTTANHRETGTDNTSTVDEGTIGKTNTTTYNEATGNHQGVGGVTTAVTKALPASSATNSDLGSVSIGTPNSRSFSASKPNIAFATGENQSINQTYTDGDTSHTGTVGESGTESRNLLGRNNRTLNLSNGGTDVLTGTDNNSGSYTRDEDNEERIRNSGVDTRIVSGSITRIAEGEGVNTTSGTKSTSDTGTQNINNTDTEIYSGRDESPQELLAKAAAYVKNSCAWDWLKTQLEPCFMCIYDI